MYRELWHEQHYSFISPSSHCWRDTMRGIQWPADARKGKGAILGGLAIALALIVLIVL